jgi:peptide/nickel transport system substrate-binding protein
MRFGRTQFSFATLVIGAGLLFVGLGHAGPPNGSRDGGTFNLSFGTDRLDYIDPALAYTGEGWTVLDATCARLMSYLDKAPPEGLRLVPEVAATPPQVSRDGKTYTFTLRKGFRFSDGTPVDARAFARSIERLLAPGVNSAGLPYALPIVGAAAVRAGTTTNLPGVVATGNRLVVRFTAPVPDFPAQTSMPFFCAVPPTLPSDPEGVGAIPGSGPYYVTEYVGGKRVVLERNRFYGGVRPHHVDRILVDLGASAPTEILDRIESGQADWGIVPPPFYFDPVRGLARKYGVNRSRFFVKPGTALRGYYLNASQPLFRNNLALRRAVNFAVDRAALARVLGEESGVPTDQYLPPSMPGFRDENIFPLGGPNVRRARELARGHTRSGKAVLWTYDVPSQLAAAQVVKRNLKQIGLDVVIKGLPPGALYRKASEPNAAFDIAFGNWLADYVDPYQYTNTLFESSFIGGSNVAHFDSPRFDSLMRRAARLQGTARYRAYGDLDVQLARDAVPMIATSFDSQAALVSRRVGCVLFRAGVGLDLPAACLK